MKNHFILLSILLLCYACGKDYIYEEEKSVPTTGWSYQDTVRFVFSIEETSEIYDIWLTVNHTRAYAFQNLYVKIHTILPDGNDNTQVVSLELANKAGQWLGNCNAENCEINIPIQQNIYFETPGNYAMYIEQYMRRDTLQHINKLGLRIAETEIQKKKN